jgi:hypothetical protein
MKKILIIAVCLLSFASCTKKSSSTGSGTGGGSVSLNATESSLLGTWYQQKYQQSHINPLYAILDTTVTGYDKSCYMTFQKEPFIGTTASSNAGIYKNCTGGLSTTNTTSYVAGTGWWYYQETTKFLTIGGQNYEIISLSGSNLTIKSRLQGMNEQTYYLTK